MYVNDFFQICTVTVHTVADSFPCRHEKLFGIGGRTFITSHERAGVSFRKVWCIKTLIFKGNVDLLQS